MRRVTGDEILWLGWPASTNPCLRSQKATCLTQLVAAGFPVPEGFVATTGDLRPLRWRLSRASGVPPLGAAAVAAELVVPAELNRARVHPAADLAELEPLE
jgi:hypothetical protein